MSGKDPNPIVIKIFGKEVNLTQVLGQSEKTLGGFSRRVGKMGRSLAGGLPFGIGGGFAAKEVVSGAMEFNGALSRMYSILPGGEARIRQIGDAARTMGAKLGIGAKEMATGAYEVIHAFGDKDTEEILKMSSMAIDVFGGTIPEVLGMARQATAAYGDQSKEAIQKVLDLSTIATRFGHGSLADMSAGLGANAIVAKDLNVKQEDLFATMAAGSKVMGGMEQSGAQLRRVLSTLEKFKGHNNGFFQQFGVGVEEMIKSKGLVPTLQTIDSYAKKHSLNLQQLFGPRGFALVHALVNEELPAYNKILGEMKNSAGATERVHEEMENGVNAAGVAFERAKEKMKNAGITLGNRLLPPLTKVVNTFGQFVQDNPKITIALGGVVAGMSALSPVLMGISSGLSALSSIPGIITGIATAFKALNVAAMAGPAGLAILGIAGAGYILNKGMDNYYEKRKALADADAWDEKGNIIKGQNPTDFLGLGKNQQVVNGKIVVVLEHKGDSSGVKASIKESRVGSMSETYLGSSLTPQMAP